MNKNIPTYNFIIDDTAHSGVKTISIVDEPATNSLFVAFNNEEKKPKYVKFESDQYEQAVLGISMQPDLPIYRYDKRTGEEYYGVFSKDVIKKIVYKYHKELQSNKVNVDHNSKEYIDAFMFSDYIVDSELQVQDLIAKGIKDAKIGSWVTAFKVEDKEVFQSILNGERNGFSVEVYLDKELATYKKNNNKKNKLNMNKNKKSIMDKIIALFSEELLERALVPELAFEIEWSEVGLPVNKIIVASDGTETQEPVGKGEYTTEEGIVVVDEASNLVEVRELPEEETPVETPEVPASGDTETTISGNTEMAAYPWDTCISDQIAAGYSQDVAEKICGWIKANYTQEEAIAKALAGEVPPHVEEEEMVDEVTGVTGTTTTVKKGIDKSLIELVGTVDGYYMIDVVVKDGMIESAILQSQSELMAKQEDLNKEVEKLKKENADLLAKFENDPATAPILTPEPIVKDFSKMSAYERLMYNKGVKPV